MHARQQHCASVLDLEEHRIDRMLRMQAEQEAGALEEVIGLYRRGGLTAEEFLAIVRGGR